MAHARAFSIKAVYIFLMILAFFYLYEPASLGIIMCISVLLAGITYVIDVFLLPLYGSLVAVVLDFTSAFTIVWLISGMTLGQTTSLVLASVFVAYFFCLCEGLFHVYMKERILPKRLAIIIPFPTMHLETEWDKEVYQEKEEKD